MGWVDTRSGERKRTTRDARMKGTVTRMRLAHSTVCLQLLIGQSGFYNGDDVEKPGNTAREDRL